MNWRLPIQRVFKHRFWGKLIDLAYHDQARLVEWLSFALLLNFASEFWSNPDIVSRDTYTAFATLGSFAWSVITIIIASAQLLAIFWRGRWQAEMRAIAMLFSLAYWITVTLSFVASGVSTTATYAYLSISISTVFSFIFLLWKTAGRS